MRDLACDVAVIGGGTAGIAAFRAATEAGADCVLIERGPGGTTCARVGCMPSKLLIAAGEAAERIRQAEIFGIRTGPVRVDGPAVLGRLRAERDRFVASVFDGLDRWPADRRLAGQARFRAPDSLEITGPEGAATLRFRAAVIATGSSPVVPKPLQGLGSYLLTTDTVFELPDLPASLAVLGGGPVGLELAQAMARLGVAVTLFDTGSRLAGLTEPGLTAAARTIFAGDLHLHLDTEIVAAERDGEQVRLAWRGPAGEGSGRFERVLAATGRAPNLADLDLAAAGLATDDSGVPAFDTRSLLCRGGPVLIAGDVNAWRPVLHEASRQGGIAGANAAALVHGLPLRTPQPWTDLAIVFTHPQAARIGAAFDPGAGHVTGGVDFSDQGRARVDGVNEGALQLWADREGRLLGGEMLGPAVEHLAHLLAQAVAAGDTAQALRDRPIYHPTVEEGLGSALSEIIRKISPASAVRTGR